MPKSSQHEIEPQPLISDLDEDNWHGIVQEEFDENHNSHVPLMNHALTAQSTEQPCQNAS